MTSAKKVFGRISFYYLCKNVTCWNLHFVDKLLSKQNATTEKNTATAVSTHHAEGLFNPNPINQKMITDCGYPITPSLHWGP
jgi:hypothetical protein